MKSLTLVGWLIQTFLTTGLAKPAIGRRPHQHHERAHKIIAPSNTTLRNPPTSTVSSGAAQPTGTLNSTDISALSSNESSSNRTWYWLDPPSPKIVEDLFSPALDGIMLINGTITPFNTTLPELENQQSDFDTIEGIWDVTSLEPTSFESTSDFAASKVAATGKPKIVFAHFMVGNVPTWTADDWKADIQKAQAAHIDAFALNMAADDPSNTATLNEAFYAADLLDFKLVISFDYAGGGPWEKSRVLSFLKARAQLPAYYHHNGKAFVSTFEGWENAADWIDIKAETNCLFLPDWSSRGAKDAMALAGGVADGLFSWAAWPWGNTDMDTYVDASYIEFLKGKLYMMPVSPWFYTNMPGFDGKNWIWRGDSLWHDRWLQTLVVQPDFVQIISWNDYGESHYIGPLNNQAYGAFSRGLAPYNYVVDMPHDGWRDLLPFTIDLYKYNAASFTKEILVTWYRKHPSAACTTGGTSGSTASQLLIEFQPSEVAQDMIFYSALLASDAAVVVTIGGINLGAVFQDKPSGGIGLYHGSISTRGRTGPVSVSIARGTGSLSVNGKEITSTCEQNIQNYNAWVGSSIGPIIPSKSPTMAVNEMECTSGTGATIFAEICAFTCSYGYCPLGACQCLTMGIARKKPVSTGVKGYPQIGMSASFEGLCNFACNLGKCPTNVCRNTLVLPFAIFNPSPFLPPSCNQGTGAAPWTGLCSYACDFGYCPISVCKCTRQGTLNLPPASDSEKSGHSIKGEDGGLCKFACTRTWCPEDVCRRYADDADEPNIDESDWLPDCTASYDSIDAIIAAGTSIPYHCYGQYMVTVQAKELGNSISDYNSIMAAGYDSKFTTYARYTGDLVWPSIKACMIKAEHCYKYLTCTIFDERTCCNTCTQAQCRLNCRPDTKDHKCTKAGETVPIKCPDWIRSMGEGVTETPPPPYTFAFTDKAAFFATLADKYGIPESWTQITSHKAYVSANCGFVGPKIPDSCYVTWKNMILPAEKIDVPNPKTSFATSLTDLTALQSDLLEAAVPEGISLDFESTTDVVDAAMLPVAMAANAVVNMKAVVEKANQIEDEERKSLILFFVTSLLMFVPVIGSGAGALGFGVLRSIIRVAGVGGEAALGIWSIVQDPESAVLVIFSALLGARDYSKAAKARRGMSDKDVNALGSNVANSMSKTTKAKRDFVCAL